jgi:hypothetical protein
MKKFLLLLTSIVCFTINGLAQCTPSIQITADNTVICEGATISFTASETNGGPTPLYEWFIGTVSQGAPNGNPMFVTTALNSVNNVVSAQLTSNASCATITQALSNSMQIIVSQGIGAGTIGLSQTICYNTIPADLKELTAATGITGTAVYTWETSVDGATGWAAITGSQSGYAFTTPLTQDLYIRRITTDPSISAPCNTATSNIIHITVGLPLTAGVIGSDQTICAGSVPSTITEITPTTGATGTYTYQWQSDASGSFKNISGVTNATFSPSNLTATTKFQRVDTSGTCGTISNIVTKKVGPILTPGVIGSDQTICKGSVPSTITEVTPTTGATGTYSYQWQSDASGSFKNISGATNATFSPSSLTATTKFQRVDTSATCITPSVLSNTIQIIVSQGIISGAIHSNQKICYNTIPASITDSTIATGIIGTAAYAWETSVDGVTGWSIITGSSESIYTFTTPLTQDLYIRRVTTDSGTPAPCNRVTSNIIHITVGPKLTGGIIGLDQIICAGSAPSTITETTAPTGGTGTYSYQWQSNASGSFINIPGATNATFSPSGLTGDTTKFQRVYTSGTCSTTPSALSNSIQIIVSHGIISGSIHSNQKICYKTIPAPIIDSTKAIGILKTAMYTWETSVDGITGWSAISGSASIYAFTTPLTQDLYMRRITTDPSIPAQCNMATSNIIHITVGPVGPLFTAAVIGSDQTICIGSIPSTIIEKTAPTGGGTYTYQWQSNTSGLFTNILGATNATFSPSGLTITTKFQRIDTSGTCRIASNVVTKTVGPPLTASVIGSDQTICAGSVPATITEVTAPTGGIGIYTYQWQSDASGSFTNIPGATNATFSPSGLTSTTKFKRVDTSGTCGTISNIVTKTFSPKFVTTVDINHPGQACAGTIMLFTATSVNGGATPSYQWYIGSTRVGTNSSTYTYTTALGDNGKYISVQLTPLGICTNKAISTTAQLNIKPSTASTVYISTPLNPTCKGLQTNFTASATGGGTNPIYQWYVIPSGSTIGSIGNPVGTNSSTFSDSNLQNGDSVYVAFTSSLACIFGKNPYPSNKIMMQIGLTSTPKIVEKDTTICADLSKTFNATITQGNTVQWYNNGSLISGATNLSYQTSKGGLYSIQEDNGGCKTSSSLPVTLTIDPCGAFSTSITGPNPIHVGQQNTVYNVYKQKDFTYDWSITGGTFVSRQDTSAVTVDWDSTSHVHSISVTETNSNKVKNTTTMVVSIQITGISTSLAQSGIVLFPNPATDVFYIEMPENGLNVSYEILDITGLSVANGTFTSSTNGQKIPSTFGPGIYQVVLHYNNSVTIGRLSKVQ